MASEDEVIDFLNYVSNNYDHVKRMADQEVLFIRNYAATHGLELTPQETEDCIRVFRWALRVLA